MTADALLAKLCGCLVIMKVSRCKEGTNGKCPVCGGTEFRHAPYGWTECAGCLEFAFTTGEDDR